MELAFSQKDLKVKDADDVKCDFTKQKDDYSIAFKEHRLICCNCFEPVQFVNGEKKYPTSSIIL